MAYCWPRDSKLILLKRRVSKNIIAHSWLSDVCTAEHASDHYWVAYWTLCLKDQCLVLACIGFLRSHPVPCEPHDIKEHQNLWLPQKLQMETWSICYRPHYGNYWREAEGFSSSDKILWHATLHLWSVGHQFHPVALKAFSAHLLPFSELFPSLCLCWAQRGVWTPECGSANWR